MSLKPLGFKDYLNPPISLGQKFKPLQAPPPLGESLNPLGQSLQPLGEFMRSPLLQASFLDDEMANSSFIPDSIMQEDMGMWRHGDTNDSPTDLLSPSSSQSPVSDRSSPIPQAKLSKDELPFQNSADLSNAIANNVDRKPLGLSQCLVQESDMLISNQVIQNKSSLDYQLPPIGEVENYSFSDSIQSSAATTGNHTDESELLDLPKINRYDERHLGFNKQLLSPVFTESLNQTQASFQEIPNSDVVKANWQESNLGKTIATPSLPPSKSPVIQADLETEETLAQTKQYLLAISSISATDGEAIPTESNAKAPASPQPIQSSIETTAAFSNEEIPLLQPETVAQKKEDLAATSSAITNQPLQQKISKAGETPTPQELLEKFNQPLQQKISKAGETPTPQELLGKFNQPLQQRISKAGETPTPQELLEKFNDGEAIPTESNAKAPALSNIIQPKQEIPTTSTTAAISASPPETVAPTLQDLSAKLTTNTTDEAANAHVFSNIIQPKQEIPTNTTNAEISPSPPETVVPALPDLAAKLTTNTTDEAAIASSQQSNLIQPKQEITTNTTNASIAASQPETIAPPIQDLSATPTTTSTDAIPGSSFANAPASPHLIQPKKETTTASIIADISPLQPETIVQPKQDLAATPTTTSTDASPASSNAKAPSQQPNLIQPSTETPTAISTSSISALQPETVAQPKQDLPATLTTNTTEKEYLAPKQQPNLIQPSTETPTAVSTSSISALQPETVAQTQVDLAATSTTTTGKDASPGSSNAKAPASPHLIQPKKETTDASITASVSGLQPETVAQPKQDLVATPTTTTDEKDLAPSQQPNLIQPKKETPTAVSTSSISALQPETVAQKKEDLSVTSSTITNDGETNAPALAKFIQPNTEISTTFSTPETSVPQQETPTQTKQDLSAIPPTITNDGETNAPALAKLIQPNTEISTTFSTPETSVPQQETPTQTKQDLYSQSSINTTDGEAIHSTTVASNTPVSSNLVQPSLETPTVVPTQAKTTPQAEIFAQPKQDLPSPPSPTTTNSEDLAPALSNIIQPSIETTDTSITAEISPSQPETVAQSKQDLSATPTTTSTDAIAPASNIIQSKQEIPTNTTTAEISPLQPETVAQSKQDLSATPTPTSTDAIAPELSNIIQPSIETTDTSITAEISASQPETVAQEKEDSAATSSTISSDIEAIPTSSNAIAPSQQNVISPKLETPTSVSAPTSDIATSHLKCLTEDNAPSLTNILETPSETSTPAPENIVQPRLDNQILNPIKPLGISKPLSQQSDFVTSGLVDDFIDKSPTSSPNPLPSDSSLPTEIANTPDSGSNLSEAKGKPANEIKDDLTSVKPLGFSQNLNNTNNFILPKLDLTGGTGEKPKTIGFDDTPDKVQQPFSNAIPDTGKDIPTSWSTISELLGKSSTTENNTVPEENESTPLSSPSPSPDAETSDIEPSNPHGETSQELTKESFPKNDSSENEQLDILAQKVYTLMRQSLEITQERHGIKVAGNPIWLSNITSIDGTPATNSGVISPLDTRLQELTQKVSLLIQKRFEIERERRGRYYAGRLPW